MFFDLGVGELEYLETVRVSCLSCFGLGKVINNFLVGVGLLDVVIVEVNNRVPIRESLSPHTVAKDHFLLSIQIRSLYLSIVAHDLILYL